MIKFLVLFFLICCELSAGSFSNIRKQFVSFLYDTTHNYGEKFIWLKLERGVWDVNVPQKIAQCRSQHYFQTAIRSHYASGKKINSISLPSCRSGEIDFNWLSTGKESELSFDQLFHWSFLGEKNIRPLHFYSQALGFEIKIQRSSLFISARFIDESDSIYSRLECSTLNYMKNCVFQENSGYTVSFSEVVTGNGIQFYVDGQRTNPTKYNKLVRDFVKISFLNVFKFNAMNLGGLPRVED